jgi:MYXO-CTERM domain-containing protein
MTQLSFRAISLGALALTILAALANSSLAQNVTTLPAITAGIPPYIIPEPPLGAPPESAMTVNIAGAVFLGAPFEVDMMDIGVTGQQVLSDRILFDNTGLGGTAMITFLSDDEQGNLPPGFPGYAPAIVTGEGPFTTLPLPMLDAGINPYTLTATMVSDDERNPNTILQPGQSDGLFLHAVATPEPSTVCLAGLGLAALAGVAYRRRRRRARTTC